MYIKLFEFVKLNKLAAGEMLFKKGDLCTYYYIVLEGKLEMLNINENGEEKIVRSVDLGALFGKKDNPLSVRVDFARASSEAIVLGIDKAAWERVRAETAKSEAEQKIEYLLRYVPKLRMSPRGIIEELEI